MTILPKAFYRLNEIAVKINPNAILYLNGKSILTLI